MNLAISIKQYAEEFSRKPILSSIYPSNSSIFNVNLVKPDVKSVVNNVIYDTAHFKKNIKNSSLYKRRNRKSSISV